MIFVDLKFDNSLPVASGLSGEWLKAQKTVKAQKAKEGPTEIGQCMDDEAALSTRPDYPPSPTKFDRIAADAMLATARAGTSRSIRKNTVRLLPFNRLLLTLNLIIVACCSCLQFGRQ